MLSLVEITAFRQESKSCKGFFLQINFPPMRALEFIRDHVTFKLPYDFSYHMKTPYISENNMGKISRLVFLTLRSAIELFTGQE